ncbi:hypothetical protein CcaverHIS641_0401610 [Cutaneotrichosporon cavernicola]|nr:hypothetical protein CcaverHIS641_0401610 [Cutaneotrichosporon cavernicola]
MASSLLSRVTPPQHHEVQFTRALVEYAVTGCADNWLDWVPKPAEDDLHTDSRLPRHMQRLEDIRDLAFAMKPSVDRVKLMVIDKDGHAYTLPNGSFHQSPLAVHPVGLHSPSNVQHVPWWYNFAKGMCVGTNLDLHMTAMHVWNGDLPIKVRELIVDFLASHMDELDNEQTMNIRNGFPDGWKRLLNDARSLGQGQLMSNTIDQRRRACRQMLTNGNTSFFASVSPVRPKPVPINWSDALQETKKSDGASRDKSTDDTDRP